MIVATAGHIDHGKTLLVKALTGVDTDRLPEEKNRGISIDIGFAYLPTPDGNLIGFVDVPGHERFIRNMLAGVCAIDEALVVVAADDGIMPQTLEHLHILDLLKVNRGIAVINKIDRVPPARVAEVAQSVRALIDGTALAGCPIYLVSALTGNGIDALRTRLLQDVDRIAARQADGQHARFAIDRVFSVQGSGTVATGTVFNGRIAAGAHLVVSPGGAAVRVRGIQVSGRTTSEARAGQRGALNLAGTDLDKASISRGDWVLGEALHHPTSRIDVHLQVLATEDRPLAHFTPAHLHLGTAAVPGRIAIRRGESIAPGEARIAQIILERPICALHGDRFVLRDASATRTLGGGFVIDPFAPATRRHTPSRLAQLAALEQAAPADALRALVEVMPEGVDLKRFEAAFNLDAEAAAALYMSLQLAILGKTDRIAISSGERARLGEAVLAEVASVHKQDPKSLGIELSTLREKTGSPLPEWAMGQLVHELAADKKLEVAGNRVRRRGHDATSNPEDEKLWALILPQLEMDRPLPPPLKDIAAALRLPDKKVSDLLHRKSRRGEPVKVADDRFMLRATVLRLAQVAADIAAAKPGGQFTAAEYRDKAGTSRNHSIEVLEFFDRIGYTQRIADARKIRRPIEQALK